MKNGRPSELLMHPLDVALYSEMAEAAGKRRFIMQ